MAQRSLISRAEILLLAYTLLVLVLLVFLLLGTGILPGLAPSTRPLAEAIRHLSYINLVPLFGAFGGLLSGAQARAMAQQERESGVPHASLSWLLDVAFGIAGAFVVFLVVPGNFNIDAGGWDTYKAFAVAVVGGYGGRRLIELEAARILKGVQAQLAENAKQMAETREVSAQFAQTVERKVDRLEKTTENMAKVFNSQAIRTEEYMAEVKRILEKQKGKGLSVVYADVDGLRQHLRGRADEREVRVSVLEELERALQAAAVERPGFEWDLFAVSPAVSDRILVLRGASLAEAARVADRARELFKQRSGGRSDLGLAAGGALTMSAGVAYSVDEQEVDGMATDAVARLKAAKESGRDRVVAKSVPVPAER